MSFDRPMRVLLAPAKPAADELCVWIGAGPAPGGAGVVVGGEASAPWQRTLGVEWAEPPLRDQLLVLARAHRDVLSRYTVPRAELLGEPRLLWVRQRVAALDPAELLDVGCGSAYSTYAVSNGAPSWASTWTKRTWSSLDRPFAKRPARGCCAPPPARSPPQMAAPTAS